MKFKVCMNTRPSYDTYECSRWLKLFYHCVLKCVIDYVKIVNAYRALAESCDNLINDNQTSCDTSESDIIDLIKVNNASKIRNLVASIKCVNLYHHYNSLHIYYILISRFDDYSYSRKWRKPYLYWDGDRMTSASDILFFDINGKRTHQYWGLKNPELADIWTYLFYWEVRGHDNYKIEEIDWWRAYFIPERCYSGCRSDKLLLEILRQELNTAKK